MYLYEDKKIEESNVMFTDFNFQQMLSAFIVLFAVIDIIGAIPIIINLKDKGKDVNALKATLISFCLLLGFFYVGDIVLSFSMWTSSRLPWLAPSSSSSCLWR